MSTIMDIYQKSEKWLRLVTLNNYAGTILCKDVLHTKEGLPLDGAQLYQILLVYKDQMKFNDQKEILCPSNGITDESKFDVTLYTSLIEVMFKSKYNRLIKDVRKNRNHIYHMANKDISESEFEKEWNSACAMLEGHGFTESVEDLKNCNLFTIKKLKKIMDSIQFEDKGSVKVLLFFEILPSIQPAKKVCSLKITYYF